MLVNRIRHQGQAGDVGIVPQAAFEIRSQVAGVMDLNFLGTDHAPSALGFHGAHRGIPSAFGYRMPQGLATMRGIKAEGGWGVVCTEEVEIHHTSDLAPYFEGRLWDDGDIPGLALMADAVHKHGALAGIELNHDGLDASNIYSRPRPSGRAP